MRTELSTCDFTYVVIGRTSHKLVLAVYIQGFPLFLPRPTSSGVCVWVLSRSVMSDSLWPRGLWPARLLGPWDFPGKNTGAGYHFPFQQIFPTWDQTHFSHLLHWLAGSLPLVPTWEVPVSLDKLILQFDLWLYTLVKIPGELVEWTVRELRVAIPTLKGWEKP